MGHALIKQPNGRYPVQKPGPLVDVISAKESRVWLVYNEACEQQADGTEVWFGGFESCGADPLVDEKTARAEREHAAKIVEIEAENRRLDAEADAAGRPRPTMRQGAPLWLEYPETWVDFIHDGTGWAGLLRIEDSEGEGCRDWLLREGIAPGQPFLVRFHSFAAAAPDYYGGYDGEDWDHEILARGPAPENVLAEIERVWAYNERLRDPICLDSGCYMFAPNTTERTACEKNCYLRRKP